MEITYKLNEEEIRRVLKDYFKNKTGYHAIVNLKKDENDNKINCIANIITKEGEII